MISGGSPIMNLSNSKIIGIHKGYDSRYRYNLGTLLKYPIKEFINNYKDYINSKSLNSFIYPIENNINNIENNIDKNNNLTKIINELKNEVKLEKEKNKKLEEKINQMQILLNKKTEIPNKGNANELLDAILKKDAIIDELKTKLNRFPFELSQGEKLMSIIFTNINHTFYYSIICKNTDIFFNIEMKLYNAFPELSENENYFIVNGTKIKRNKTLDDNKIKNNNIIVINVYE